MDERRNKAGTSEGAKLQRGWMEGIAQRTKKRPTSQDAYKKRVQGTQWLYCRWSRIQDGCIVSSRKPNLVRGRYVGSTDKRCRLEYDILTHSSVLVCGES